MNISSLAPRRATALAPIVTAAFGLLFLAAGPVWETTSQTPAGPGSPSTRRPSLEKLARTMSAQELASFSITRPAEFEQALSVLKSPGEKQADAAAQSAILHPRPPLAPGAQTTTQRALYAQQILDPVAFEKAAVKSKSAARLQLEAAAAEAILHPKLPMASLALPCTPGGN